MARPNVDVVVFVVAVVESEVLPLLQPPLPTSLLSKANTNPECKLVRKSRRFGPGIMYSYRPGRYPLHFPSSLHNCRHSSNCCSFDNTVHNDDDDEDDEDTASFAVGDTRCIKSRACKSDCG